MRRRRLAAALAALLVASGSAALGSSTVKDPDPIRYCLQNDDAPGTGDLIWECWLHADLPYLGRGTVQWVGHESQIPTELGR